MSTVSKRQGFYTKVRMTFSSEKAKTVEKEQTFPSLI